MLELLSLPSVRTSYWFFQFPVRCCLPQLMRSMGREIVCVEYRAEAWIKTSGPVFLTLRCCCPGDVTVIFVPTLLGLYALSLMFLATRQRFLRSSWFTSVKGVKWNVPKMYKCKSMCNLVYYRFLNIKILSTSFVLPRLKTEQGKEWSLTFIL